MNFSALDFGYTTAAIVILCICIGLFILYLKWLFIKSAVREGVKEAVKQTLIDTGTISHPNNEPRQAKTVHTTENYSQ